MQRTVPTRTTRSRGSTGAPATFTFLISAVVIFFLTGMGSMNSDLLLTLAQDNVAVAAGEWWRLFTPVLVHASFSHLLFNMWALWALGPQIERGVGSLPFVGLYLASAGVGGAVAYHIGGFQFAVGASGAIFGLFGVWLSWAFHRRGTAGGRAMLSQLGFLLLINAALPFLIPNIAWEAHLGGLIAGVLIGEVWRLIRGPNAEQMRALAAFAVAFLAALSVLI